MSAISPLMRFVLLPAQAGPTLVLLLLTPVVPGIAAYFGPDGRMAAQLIVTFPFLGLMLGSLLSGFAIHRLGLRRLIQLSYAGWVASGAIGLFADGLPLLLLGGAVLGLCTAFFTSGLAAMTSIFFTGDARGRMVGMQSAAAQVIGVGVTLLAATLVASFGWRVPYAAILVYGGVLLVLSSMWLPKASPEAHSVNPSFRAVIMHIWPICVGGATIFVLATNESTHLPFLLESGGLDSASLRSLVTISTPCAAFFGALFFSAAQGRLNNRIPILIAGAFFAAGWSTFGFWVEGLTVAMAAAALIGVAMGILSPLMFAAIMRAAPGEETGTAIGLLNVAIFFGSFINPLVTAPLRAFTDASGLMILTAMIALAASLIAASWRWSSDGVSVSGRVV